MYNKKTFLLSLADCLRENVRWQIVVQELALEASSEQGFWCENLKF